MEVWKMYVLNIFAEYLQICSFHLFKVITSPTIITIILIPCFKSQKRIMKVTKFLKATQTKQYTLCVATDDFKEDISTFQILLI